jgi:hypothetical protein
MTGDRATHEASGAEIEVVLSELSGSGALGLLGMSTDDLDAARGDATLLETLRITHELLQALRDQGVFAAFLSMPKDKQANFVRWIGATDEANVRHDRTHTFISALKQSPLGG